MMKFFIVLTGLVVMTMSQRPPYAGRPNRFPETLPQYLPAESTAANSASAGVGQRLGGGSDATVPPYNGRYDAFNDPKVWEMYEKLPVDQQPYWYINREAIAAQGGIRVSGPPKQGNVNPNNVNRARRSVRTSSGPKFSSREPQFSGRIGRK